MSRIIALCELLLRQAVVWGGMACFAFYVLVVQNLDRGGSLHHYFAGDGWEVKVAATLLFFVGVATLVIKLFGVVVQLGSLERVSLGPLPADGHAAEDVDGLVRELDETAASHREGYLVRRLRDALEFVKQKGSADALESQLCRLADADRRKMKDSYAALRVIAAAIPVLGLLGTVVGVTIAVAEIAPADMQGSLPGMIGGLGVAFDTLASALVLSVLLLFAKLGVQRTEIKLLAAVDDSVSRQLLRRFRLYGSENDAHVAAIKRMSEKVLETVEAASTRHEAALAKSLAAASRRWEEMASAANVMVQHTLNETLATATKAHAEALNDGVAKHTAELQSTLLRHAEILGDSIDRHTAGLADSLEQHAAVMTETERSLAAENQQHLAEMEAALGESMLVAATRQEKLIAQSEELLKELQVALVEAAGATVAQQEQLVRQSDVLLKVVEATGQIRVLEDALNSNLASLASSHNFEHTLTSLAAAVQLLCGAMPRGVRVHNAIDLAGDEASHAA